MRHDRQAIVQERQDKDVPAPRDEAASYPHRRVHLDQRPPSVGLSQVEVMETGRPDNVQRAPPHDSMPGAVQFVLISLLSVE